MKAKKKGWWTFKSAGVLFILSALPEIFSLTSAVPLLGGIHGGAVAAGYHLMYFVIYLTMGTGLWCARPWGYKMVFVGTAVYTLDKLLYLQFRESAEQLLVQQLDRFAGAGQMMDQGVLAQVMLLTVVVTVASWWGFAIYTYCRRAYFYPEP